MHWLIAHVMTDQRDFLSHLFIYFVRGSHYRMWFQKLTSEVGNPCRAAVSSLSPQECLALWHHMHISWLTAFGAHASPATPSSQAPADPARPIPQRDATLRVGLSPLCAPAAACSSRRSDTQAGPCTASVSCRRVQTETSRTGRGLGWTWCFLARRTSRFQRPTGTAAHMGVRCSPKTPSGKQPLSRLGCTLQVGLPSSLL